MPIVYHILAVLRVHSRRENLKKSNGGGIILFDREGRAYGLGWYGAETGELLLGMRDGSGGLRRRKTAV